MASDDPKATDDLLSAFIRALPEFPGKPCGDYQTLAQSFGWAQSMITIHGAHAPYYALNALLFSINNQDRSQVVGWHNISTAIAELMREPGFGDTVH